MKKSKSCKINACSQPTRQNVTELNVEKYREAREYLKGRIEQNNNKNSQQHAYTEIYEVFYKNIFTNNF
jgi:hypothetical protein